MANDGCLIHLHTEMQLIDPDYCDKQYDNEVTRKHNDLHIGKSQNHSEKRVL